MVLLLLFVSIYFIDICHGKTDAEIKAKLIGLGVECSKDHPVTIEDLHAISRHEYPDHTNAKCLMACVFRKVQWLDSKGMFDTEKAIELSKIEHPDELERQENAKKLFEHCKQVNEEPVGDAETGCDRAYLITKCLAVNGRKITVCIVVFGFHCAFHPMKTGTTEITFYNYSQKLKFMSWVSKFNDRRDMRKILLRIMIVDNELK